jgi:demethylmenaquinone methyltransferase / 2-methoxy-6-polyprenyl-1,4-benzoquinol methylase
MELATSVVPPDARATSGRLLPPGGGRRRAPIGSPVVALPQGDEKVRAVRAMFDTIAPRYDLVNRVMTLRLDVRWRRVAVRALGLPRGGLVADLAAGTGDLCIELERHGLRALSFDLSLGMLDADRSGAPRVEADILRLPLPDGVLDGAVSGFALRNLVDLPRFFAELHRVVRPRGRIALLDVATPANPVLRAGHAVYFGRVVPLIGGLLSDPAAYRYLPKSVAYLPSPDDLVTSLGDAGFSSVGRRLLSGGITQLLTATRR